MSGEGDDDDGDKQYEPSQKKLDDSREKGEVPRSTDLITTGSYAGLLLVAIVLGATTLGGIGAELAGLLANADHLSRLVDNGSGTRIVGGVMAQVALLMTPWVVLPFALALLSAIAQQAFLVTGSKLQPKLSRISLLSNAKNKFGRNGLFEFAKSAVKLLIFSTILFAFISAKLPQILSSVTLTPGGVTTVTLSLATDFMVVVVAVSLVIGGVDFMWQRAEHLRKNRMSRKDMTDEHKQSEGDPHMKQQRRQRGYEIAMNTMLSDVPDAAVVIVNPTHYAVALKWDRSAPGAPVCVAKGVDMVAARIREMAAEAGVPIHSDPPTARALHAMVEVGDEIDAEHYAAVAVAIRFAEELRRKVRAR